jgi:hypothetical protein
MSLPARKVGQHWKWENGTLTALYEITRIENGKCIMKMIQLLEPDDAKKYLHSNEFEYDDDTWIEFESKWSLMFEPTPEEEAELISGVIVI